MGAHLKWSRNLTVWKLVWFRAENKWEYDSGLDKCEVGPHLSSPESYSHLFSAMNQTNFQSVKFRDHFKFFNDQLVIEKLDMISKLDRLKISLILTYSSERMKNLGCPDFLL